MKENGYGLLNALALAAALAATSGCFLAAVGAAGAAGAGGGAYGRGELDATLDGPYDAVISASDSALERLQFARIRETKDAFPAEIVARTAEDKKVDVKVAKEADRLTKVSIRIGLFGDEEKSKAVLENIRDEL
jgi:hypothetical protein